MQIDFISGYAKFVWFYVWGVGSFFCFISTGGVGNEFKIYGHEVSKSFSINWNGHGMQFRAIGLLYPSLKLWSRSKNINFN